MFYVIVLTGNYPVNMVGCIQKIFRINAKRNMTGTAGQLRVCTHYFEEVPIPLTTLVEQSQIVQGIETRLFQCDNLEKSIEENLKKSEVLRQSRLKKAFDGELTVKWREENPELITGENSAQAILERIREEKAKMKIIKTENIKKRKK